jgi:hypothetical protein
MFDWFKKRNKENHEKTVSNLIKRVEAMETKHKVQNAPGMFFIKTPAGTFANTQFKSINRNGQYIELRFYNIMDYTFKSQKPKEVYNAIIKALADAAAKLVPCTINEAPTPYGMFSYHENPYPGPTGEDLIVDIDAIVKEVRREKCVG